MKRIVKSKRKYRIVEFINIEINSAELKSYLKKKTAFRQYIYNPLNEEGYEAIIQGREEIYEVEQDKSITELNASISELLEGEAIVRICKRLARKNKAGGVHDT